MQYNIVITHRVDKPNDASAVEAANDLKKAVSRGLEIFVMLDDFDLKEIVVKDKQGMVVEVESF